MKVPAHGQQDFRVYDEFLNDRYGFTAAGPVEIEAVRIFFTCAVTAEVRAQAFAGRPEYSRRFLDEAASDPVNLAAPVFSGHRKPCYFLPRSYLENTLRHTYYFQHPVEYEHNCNRAASFIARKDIVGYLGVHPVLHGSSYTPDVMASIGTLYAELSLHVHSRRVGDSDLTRYLGKVAFDPGCLATVTDCLSRAASNLHCLPASMHRGVFVKLDPVQRSLVRRTMCVELRQAYTRER
jgi:hypothetical protein